MAAKGNNKGKGKSKLAYAPKPKIPPPPKKEEYAKDSVCHHCGDTGHWKWNRPQYLSELLKYKKLPLGASTSGIFTIELFTFLGKSWVYDTGCGTHICNTTQGFRRSRKLKPGALSLYTGNGQRVAVKAIGSYDLCFPSGLVLVLHNCHYAPSITRGVISVSRLYDDGFINHFKNNNSILVSKDNLIYFNVVPRDGIFEIVLSNSNTNDCSMYVVSNKRAKLKLNSSLLWRCRLGHISKKRIEKLQHDGLLNSIDTKVFEKCVSCFSGKMARKPYSHQVERAKDLLGLIHTNCFWDYALESAKRILNMVPTKKVEKTPYEVWYGKAPKLSYLKVLECKALVKRDTLTKPDKLEPRSINLITQEASGSLEDLELIQEEDTHPSKNTSSHHDEDNQEIDEPQTDEYELRDLNEPANYKDALSDPEFDKWLNAINLEMQSMKDNEVWDLVDLPPNGKTVGSKWLFKKKTNMDGAVHTYKYRLVAKGFTQTPRIDYEETFSPIENIRVIRILIAIAAFYDYEIWQMDVKTAFLNQHLSEEVYMEQPEGFVNPKFPNQDVKSYLRRCFAMKDLGEAAYILGIKIYRDRLKRLIDLCQSAYIKKILKRYFMENFTCGSILMQEKLKLSKSQGELHWTVVQNILKYLCNTKDMFLAYGGDIKRELRVSCYTDTGYLTDADDLKSQTGYVFVLNGEAEYIAASDASKEAVWARKFIYKLGVVPTVEEPIKMYRDNTRAITIANESGITKGTKGKPGKDERDRGGSGKKEEKKRGRGKGERRERGEKGGREVGKGRSGEKRRRGETKKRQEKEGGERLQSEEEKNGKWEKRERGGRRGEGRSDREKREEEKEKKKMESREAKEKGGKRERRKKGRDERNRGRRGGKKGKKRKRPKGETGEEGTGRRGERKKG
ncbi:retrotransposon protein, putative, ty1-copia subclass [Tanacetum coccineum]